MAFAPDPSAGARPRVLVPACNRMIGALCYHVAASKYVDAVRLAGCQPLIVPGVEPRRARRAARRSPTACCSPARPRTCIRATSTRTCSTSRCRSTRRATPGPCRSFPKVARAAACRCSRSAAASRKPTSRSAARCTRRCTGSPATPTTATATTIRSRCSTASRTTSSSSPAACSSACSATATIAVNSLHGQGVNRLAPGLRVEARAPDGLVEAFSVRRSHRLRARRAVASRNGTRPRTRSRCACSARSATRRARTATWRGRARRVRGGPPCAGRPRCRRFADLERWLDEHGVTEIECLVPDLTGVARGKILPRERFTEERGMRLPEGTVALSVTGEVPRDGPVLRRHPRDRSRHAPAARSEHRAHRAVGDRPDRAGHPRLLRRRRPARAVRAALGAAPRLHAVRGRRLEPGGRARARVLPGRAQQRPRHAAASRRSAAAAARDLAPVVLDRRGQRVRSAVRGHLRVLRADGARTSTR